MTFTLRDLRKGCDYEVFPTKDARDDQMDTKWPTPCHCKNTTLQAND